MVIEKLAEILIIYIHVPLGGIALLTGGISLIAKKGNRIHKKSGKIFFYSMLFSAISAFLISIFPNHESPFLFSIGLFSAYFLISGLRSLNYKKKNFELRTDKIIAYLIFLTGISMILYPIILYSKVNIILSIFGTVGIIFGFRDLMLFRDNERLKKNWLKLHLGKMTGGYIAAVSAFFVVNQILPGIWNWFVPGIVGSGYIAYWMMKLNKKKPVANKRYE
jgi:uncharacterized membrane protein